MGSVEAAVTPRPQAAFKVLGQVCASGLTVLLPGPSHCHAWHTAGTQWMLADRKKEGGGEQGGRGLETSVSKMRGQGFWSP